ncbi:hypothetical protein [Methylobacterium sp. CM6257]
MPLQSRSTGLAAAPGAGASPPDMSRLRAASAAPWILIPAGMLVLLVPALLNGFPFVFQDTSDYLIFTPRLYRSPFYGLFLFGFHLNRFVWAPVIAQALIGSVLIHLLVQVLPLRNRPLTFAGLILFLGAFSALPWFAGFLMPDIFTAYLFLAFYLIGFHLERFGRPLQVGLVGFACVAVAVHLSHLVLACGAIAVFALLSRWLRQPWRRTCLRSAILGIPVVLTVCAYGAYNRVVFHTLAVSPAGQTFFLANLIEYGPARAYLREACPGAGYRICAQVETLPATANEFLWEAGHLDRLGGFAGMSAESPVIVRATLLSRPGAVAAMIAGNLWRALGAHAPDTDVSSAFPPYTTISEIIGLKFGPQARAAFQASAQMRDAVPHGLIRTVDAIVVALAWVLAAATCMAAIARGDRALAALPLFFATCILGDTLVCATLSGVFDRYQARVMWLLPMAALLCLVALRDGARRGRGSP